MKKKLWTLVLCATTIFVGFNSCKKTDSSTSSQQTPAKKGALLFWTNNPTILSSCGVLTVKLGNGQQANITGYYFVAPTNCVNLFGGYLYVDEGSYTYQVLSSYGCNINGGTVTVIGDQCNLARIQ
jgi:hypothetical protein